MQLRDQGCFTSLLETFCNATAEQRAQLVPLVPVLLGAAERCANSLPPAAVTCPDGTTLPTASADGGDALMAGAGAPMPEGGAGAAAVPMGEPGLPAAAGGGGL